MFIIVFNVFYIFCLCAHHLGFVELDDFFRWFISGVFVFLNLYALIKKKYFLNGRKGGGIDDISIFPLDPKKPSPGDFNSVEFMADLNKMSSREKIRLPKKNE